MNIYNMNEEAKQLLIRTNELKARMENLITLATEQNVKLSNRRKQNEAIICTINVQNPI